MKSVNYSVIFLLIFFHGATVAQPYQDMNLVYESAKSFGLSHYNKAHRVSKEDRVNLTIRQLDARVRFSQCVKPLTIEPLARLSGSTMTLKVICDDQKPWSVFLSATVKHTKPVLMATQTIERNTSITPHNTEWVDRDIFSMRQYIDSMSDVENKVSKRRIIEGDTIKPFHLKDKMMVERGQTVVIEAKSDNFSVMTKGLALSNGTIGDRINVENTRSEKRVQATVTGPGRVGINL